MKGLRHMVAKDRLRSLRWRDVVSALVQQSRTLRPVFVLIYTPVVIAFGIVILIRLRTGIAISEFTRDPLGFTGIPVYTGMLSNRGTMTWTGTAAVCLFGCGTARAHNLASYWPRV